MLCHNSKGHNIFQCQVNHTYSLNEPLTAWAAVEKQELV